MYGPGRRAGYPPKIFREWPDYPPMERQQKMNQHNAIPVSAIDLRELSEIFSHEDLYLSIYLPTATRNDRSLNTSYLESRERDIEKVIGRDIAGCFRSTLDMVRKNLESEPKENERGQVIFASRCEGFIREYRITAEPERKMVLDSSPYLLPLARLQDEFEDYGLLLVDSQEARLMMVRSSVMEEEGSASIDLMNKHKKGGMSQMRFNRLRRGAIKSFIKDVLEDLRAMDDFSEMRGLVVAGPGNTKKHLLDEMPKEFSDMIIGVLDVDMGISAGELVELADIVAAKDERAEEASLVKALEGSIMKGEPSVYGIENVISAVKQARVAVLLILKGEGKVGWKCEGCKMLKADDKIPSTCPNCGSKPVRVNVVEEIFELAEQTDARTEFVEDSPFLESIGGIGALLRY